MSRFVCCGGVGFVGFLWFLMLFALRWWGRVVGVLVWGVDFAYLWVWVPV